MLGSLAGGGTLGLLIPPSLSQRNFGPLTETSIGRLFLSGIGPGLMVSLMVSLVFMVCISGLSLCKPSVAPRSGDQNGSVLALVGLVQVRPILLRRLAVRGSIVFGWATPSEAAGVGVVVAIMIEIGQLTPPVGLNLSVLAVVTWNEVSLSGGSPLRPSRTGSSCSCRLRGQAPPRSGGRAPSRL